MLRFFDVAPALLLHALLAIAIVLALVYVRGIWRFVLFVVALGAAANYWIPRFPP